MVKAIVVLPQEDHHRIHIIGSPPCPRAFTLKISLSCEEG